MAITRTDRDQVFGLDGALVSDVPVVRDVTAETNDRAIRDQAAQAMVGNRAYVALAAPTAAQTTAQVKALSQQMNALIRLALGQLDATN